MRIHLVLWLVLSLAGVGVIAFLPEGGQRLFSISAAHGPSAMDSVGVALLIAGWLVLLSGLWGRRRHIRSRLRPSLAGTGLYLLGLGSGLLIASVASDFAHWWTIGIVLLLVVQGGMVYLATTPLRANPNP